MPKIHSTKTFVNLPCAHAQYFDVDSEGNPGPCASLHGYDRSVKFTFSGIPDEHGWIVPFGGLKLLKQWLEYYFDHTSVLPADDPRLPIEDTLHDGILSTLRVLPYGVSMEMSSLFIWEHVNPWIYQITQGRVYVSRIETIEHERNSGFLTSTEEEAKEQAVYYINNQDEFLPKQSVWDFVRPGTALDALNSLTY